jgi:hypothetical protein
LETVALFSPEITGQYTAESDARALSFMNTYTHFDPIVAADPSSFVLPQANEIHNGKQL